METRTVQGSLLGIGLMAAVVVVGSIIGFRLSSTKGQVQATLAAFAALALVVVLFCAVVIVSSQLWALPLFAGASIVVPVATYGIATALLLRFGRNSQVVVPRAPGRAVHSIRAAAGAPLSAGKAAGKTAPVSDPRPKHAEPGMAAQAVEPIAEEAIAAGSEAPAPIEENVAVEEAVRIEPAPAASERAIALEPAPAPVEEFADIQPQGMPEPSFVAPAAEEPAFEPEPPVMPVAPATPAVPAAPAAFEPTVGFEPTPDVPLFAESASEPVVPLEIEPVSEPVVSLVSEPVPEYEPPAEFEPAAFAPAPEPVAPLEPASAPEPPAPAEPPALEPAPPAEPPALEPAAPALASAPEPAAFDAASYFERATALRDKGLFAVAARLYAECAGLAEDRATCRKASIEELACYVKAGKLDRARDVAEQLNASAHDLTAVERIKIDAVLKAL